MLINSAKGNQKSHQNIIKWYFKVWEHPPSPFPLKSVFFLLSEVFSTLDVSKDNLANDKIPDPAFAYKGDDSDDDTVDSGYYDIEEINDFSGGVFALPVPAANMSLQVVKRDYFSRNVSCTKLIPIPLFCSKSGK